MVIYTTKSEEVYFAAIAQFYNRLTSELSKSKDLRSFSSFPILWSFLAICLLMLDCKVTSYQDHHLNYFTFTSSSIIFFY